MRSDVVGRRGTAGLGEPAFAEADEYAGEAAAEGGVVAVAEFA